jgi:hypothetical protein
VLYVFFFALEALPEKHLGIDRWTNTEQTDCWNEAAGSAGCDPNIDDDCLCGPFFDDVAGCTAALCNAGENLGMLQFFIIGVE